MNFPQAIASCFQKYATFSGRSLRSEYWYWILFTIVASVIISAIEMPLGLINASGMGYLSMIFTLATLLPGTAVACRRLHDVNRSGWWMLIAITIIGIIPLIYWYASKGTEGDNRFGADPLQQ